MTRTARRQGGAARLLVVEECRALQLIALGNRAVLEDMAPATRPPTMLRVTVTSKSMSARCRPWPAPPRCAGGSAPDQRAAAGRRRRARPGPPAGWTARQWCGRSRDAAAGAGKWCSCRRGRRSGGLGACEAGPIHLGEHPDGVQQRLKLGALVALTGGDQLPHRMVLTTRRCRPTAYRGGRPRAAAGRLGPRPDRQARGGGPRDLPYRRAGSRSKPQPSRQTGPRSAPLGQRGTWRPTPPTWRPWGRRGRVRTRR